MREDFMPVQHYKQGREGTCLPACVKMVLSAQGDDYSEQQLVVMLDSYEFGTPTNHALRLQHFGYSVEYGALTLKQVQQALAQNRYSIAFVRADFLPWNNFFGFHAVVIAEVNDDGIALFDPVLDSGPTHASVNSFLMAWEEFDSLAAILTKLNKP